MDRIQWMIPVLTPFRGLGFSRPVCTLLVCAWFLFVTRPLTAQSSTEEEKFAKLPAEVQKVYHQATLAWKNAKYEEALTLYKKVLASSPDFLETQRAIAIVLLSMKNYTDATTTIKQYLNLRKSDYKAWGILGEINHHQGNFSQAVDAYSKSINIDASHPETFYNRADAFILLDEPGKALTDYQRVLKLDPSYKHVHTGLALAYLRLYRLEDGLAETNKGIDQDVSDAMAWGIRGVCYYGLNKLDKAKDSINKSIELDPSKQSTYIIEKIRLAVTLTRMKNYEDAARSAQRYLDEYPSDAKAWHLLGQIYNHQLRYDDAIVVFNTCLKIDSKYISVYLDRGMSYVHSSQPDKGLKDFQELLRLDPKHPQVHFACAFAHLKLNQFQKALVASDLALLTDASDANLWGIRGICYFALGETEKAEKSFRKCIEIDPSKEMQIAAEKKRLSLEQK